MSCKGTRFSVVSCIITNSVTVQKVLLRQLEDVTRELAWANARESDKHMAALQYREDARQSAARVYSLEVSLQHAHATATQAALEREVSPCSSDV